MRPKAIPRERKVKPVLEYGVEEQNAGIASNYEEQDSGQVKKSTKDAQPLLQQSGKSKRGKKRKRLNSSKTILSKESNSKIRKLNQEVTNKQMTPIQDSGRLTLVQPPNGVKENTFELAVTERNAPVDQPLTDSPGCGIKSAQPLQQSLELLTKKSCEQPENNVVSRGSEEIPLAQKMVSDSKQESIQQHPAQEMIVRSIQKATDTEKQNLIPMTAPEYNDEIDKPGKEQGNKVTVKSEQKVKVTEEQTVLLSNTNMRPKAIPRKRKVKPVLEYGVEEQNAGIASNYEEQDSGQVKKSTQKAQPLLQQSGKTKKGRKRKRLNSSKTILSTESNSKIRKLNQEVANKQILVTSIQESGGLPLVQPQNGVKENTIKSAKDRKEVPLPQPSINTPGWPSLVSQQPVQPVFGLNSAYRLQSVISKIKTSQTLRQTSGFSMTIPFERPENNVVSLRGKGISQTRAGVKQLETTEELFPRCSIEDPDLHIPEIYANTDADILVDCSERGKCSVKEGTIKALRVKLRSNIISDNTGKNGKSLNINKTISANGCSLTTPCERPEYNFFPRVKGVSQTRAGVKQLEITEELWHRWLQTQAAKTVACKQKAKVTDFVPGITQNTSCKIDIPDADIAVGCSEQRKDSVKESTKKALRQKLLSNRISGNTGKNGKTVSAKGSVLGILERKQGNAVTERNALVVQPIIDSPGCLSLKCHQMLQAVTSNRRNHSQSVMYTSGLSGIKPAQPLQKVLAFSMKKTCEQPQINVFSLSGEEISLAQEMVSNFDQESIQRHPEQEMIVRSIQKATETEERNLIPVTAQEYNDEIDKPGATENCVERNKGQVRPSTKDALRRKVQSKVNASKKGKYRKRLNTNKNKSMSPIKKSKRLTWKEEMEDYKLPHPCFQMNAAEQAKMTLDIKSQSNVFRQIPAIPKTNQEQTLKIGQTKTFSTFEDIPVQIEVDVDAGNGGNLPDFSKLFERWTGY